jgi:hypothetical protein
MLWSKKHDAWYNSMNKKKKGKKAGGSKKPAKK